MDIELINTMKNIASNVRNMRAYKGFTQDYIAEKLGISQNAYSKLELNYSKITLDRMFQLAEVLECDISDLFIVEPGLTIMSNDAVEQS